jgi:hypothetical protein
MTKRDWLELGLIVLTVCVFLSLVVTPIAVNQGSLAPLGAVWGAAVVVWAVAPLAAWLDAHIRK